LGRTLLTRYAQVEVAFVYIVDGAHMINKSQVTLIFRLIRTRTAIFEIDHSGSLFLGSGESPLKGSALFDK
jgi:hypothetical protein